MGFTERRARVHPEMQIDEHVICRAASTDLFGADDARNRLHNRTDILLRQDDLIGKNARGFTRNFPAGISDKNGNNETGNGIEDGIAKPDAGKSAEYGERGPDIALRMPRVRAEHFASEACSGAR